MNDDAKQGLNTAERGRTRNALNENRKELRRARRAAENDHQKDDLQVRIDENERQQARVDLIALKDRDDDGAVTATITSIEGAVSEVKKAVDDMERATEKAQALANVVAKADQTLGLVSGLLSFVS